MSDEQHVPFFATAHGESYGACLCGWESTRGHTGDKAWREQQAQRDAQAHADENGEQQ